MTATDGHDPHESLVTGLVGWGGGGGGELLTIHTFISAIVPTPRVFRVLPMGSCIGVQHRASIGTVNDSSLHVSLDKSKPPIPWLRLSALDEPSDRHHPHQTSSAAVHPTDIVAALYPTDIVRSPRLLMSLFSPYPRDDCHWSRNIKRIPCRM